ncbi:DUF2948 family protein [Roseovarius sp. SCSIO 43702]|uniref:DUF2948 family protein n=1 Tax=Roseovarius sp. SCSIO 43702 TaxID=2823043 RepID=UPI001C73A35C|nr:DUF2948 family protein [Roseovarius sp. SCSIO 43702]QYX56284.1 DUF2948 family protein [Roseovarius sp. SCSIO 43702]
MSENDARFEDGREAPLDLGAWDPDDLSVLSALAQDAVFPASEMSWRAGERRFALLLNRFRWEDRGRERHEPERVQSLLVVENVLRVASQGIDRHDGDLILSLLSVTFEPGEDGTGHVLLTLAGDGAIRLAVEALELRLRDVTRPYVAPSRKVPDHGA